MGESVSEWERVDRSETCLVCGASLVCTFVIRPGEPVPVVRFRHLPGGGHSPELSGTGEAATARRRGQVLATETRKLDA